MSTFRRKEFIAKAESWIEKQRLEWIATVKASPLAPYALMWAVREGLVLDTEELDAITADSLFPSADIIPRANAVFMELEGATEIAAKLAISSAVKSSISEANAGIEAVRASEHSPQPILAPPATGTVSGSETTPKTPPVASGRAVAGHIEAVATDVIRVHRANIGGTEVYTTQRNIMDTLQAAQAQGITLRVDYKSGDFGNRVVGCKVTDAVKEL